jgi:hypothetical protein
LRENAGSGSNSPAEAASNAGDEQLMGSSLCFHRLAHPHQTPMHVSSNKNGMRTTKSCFLRNRKSSSSKQKQDEELVDEET